jgi:hypothetical protein
MAAADGKGARGFEIVPLDSSVPRRGFGSGDSRGVENKDPGSILDLRCRQSIVSVRWSGWLGV